MRLSIVVFVFVLLAGCATTSQMPNPAVSEFVETEGAFFLTEPQGEQTKVLYAMTYKFRKPLPNGVVSKVEFENPEPNGAPLVVQQTIESGQTQLSVRSPLLPGMINNHNYTVILRLYEGETLFSTHTDSVRFQLQPEMVKILRLKLY